MTNAQPSVKEIQFNKSSCNQRFDSKSVKVMQQNQILHFQYGCWSREMESVLWKAAKVVWVQPDVKFLTKLETNQGATIAIPDPHDPNYNKNIQLFINQAHTWYSVALMCKMNMGFPEMLSVSLFYDRGLFCVCSLLYSLFLDDLKQKHFSIHVIDENNPQNLSDHQRNWCSRSQHSLYIHEFQA